MKRIPLITSIPPAMSRRDRNGDEIGEEYSRRCIESWIESGFRPVSVNSRREMDNQIRRENGICYEIVDQDASPVVGKPLVFLGDMLRVATKVSDGPVVITNADILLDTAYPILDVVENVQPGKGLLGRRIDIDKVDARNGNEFENGIDFFAFHSRDLGRYVDSRFIFGVPWWDHYLPIAMALNGVNLSLLEDSFAFHLVHSERWDLRLWIEYGEMFIATMKGELALSQDDDNSVAKMYSEYFDVSLVPMTPNLKSLIKVFVRSQSIGQQILLDQLRRVSDANVRFITGLLRPQDALTSTNC